MFTKIHFWKLFFKYKQQIHSYFFSFPWALARCPHLNSSGSLLFTSQRVSPYPLDLPWQRQREAYPLPFLISPTFSTRKKKLSISDLQVLSADVQPKQQASCRGLEQTWSYTASELQAGWVQYYYILPIKTLAESPYQRPTKRWKTSRSKSTFYHRDSRHSWDRVCYKSPSLSRAVLFNAEFK